MTRLDTKPATAFRKLRRDGVEMLNQVYSWVKETRRGLLAYCASIPSAGVSTPRPEFGHGSILNTVLHVADCYRFWIAETTFGRDLRRFSSAGYPDVASISTLFSEVVDPLVEEFMALHAVTPAGKLTLKVRWQPAPMVVTPLWLLTHVITHEFHHKGQVVAFGRILGYPPPETDLAEPKLAG